MHKISPSGQTKHREEKMKEIYMLAGLGLGVIAGIMLYRYCDGTEKVVAKTEKAVIKEAEKMEKQAKETINKLNKKSKNQKNN